MEVLKSGDAPALVTNLEAMQLLGERMASRRSPHDGDDDAYDATPAASDDGHGGDARKGGPFQNRDWIERTVFDYLRSSPCGGEGVKQERMPELVEMLRRDPSEGRPGDDSKGYGLTNAETLQILNHLPTSLVELHLLIEDIEKRHNLEDEENQMEFLKLISGFSGRPVEGGNADGNDY